MIAKLKNNQKGMASIMFAIFIILIVALIAIGYATMVRNDQRQTLDKTLSNQAQYAAETAINKIQTKIKAGTALDSNSSCYNIDSKGNSDIVSGPGESGKLDANFPGVKVTCLTWTSVPTSLAFSNVGYSPAVSPIMPVSAIDKLKITWTGNGSIYGCWDDGSGGEECGVDYGVAVCNNATLRLSCDTAPPVKTPAIKIALTKNNDLPNLKAFYALPSDSVISREIDYGTSPSGSTVRGECWDSASGKYTCEVIIKGLSTWVWTSPNSGLISVGVLGGPADINIQALSLGGASVALKGSQISIDANAQSQDVIKRLKATVSLTNNTWRPYFAASADSLCKNYAIDGSVLGNNLYSGMVSTSTAKLCPQN